MQIRNFQHDCNGQSTKEKSAICIRVGTLCTLCCVLTRFLVDAPKKLFCLGKKKKEFLCFLCIWFLQFRPVFSRFLQFQLSYSKQLFAALVFICIKYQTKVALCRMTKSFYCTKHVGVISWTIKNIWLIFLWNVGI